MNDPVPASRADDCACCATPYPAGALIAWDRAATGWVLATHRSLAGQPIDHPNPDPFYSPSPMMIAGDSPSVPSTRNLTS
jgi:hypothetical protein